MNFDKMSVTERRFWTRKVMEYLNDSGVIHLEYYRMPDDFPIIYGQVQTPNLGTVDVAIPTHAIERLAETIIEKEGE